MSLVWSISKVFKYNQLSTKVEIKMISNVNYFVIMSCYLNEYWKMESPRNFIQPICNHLRWLTTWSLPSEKGYKASKMRISLNVIPHSLASLCTQKPPVLKLLPSIFLGLFCSFFYDDVPFIIFIFWSFLQREERKCGVFRKLRLLPKEECDWSCVQVRWLQQQIKLSATQL